jgi:AcrR family transcriptional regulator
MVRSAAARQGSPHVHAKRERRRGEILRAALRAFRERGYHATTLDDIAEHLGVRKTALYHYFPDRESILFECHRESLAELDRILADARGIADPAARLRHVIAEHVRVMTDTLDGSPLAFEVPALSPGRQGEIIAGRDRYERALRRLIAQGVRAGEFRAVDAKIAVFALLGSINWVARWYRPGGALDADALGAQFADLLVGGLAVRGTAGGTRAPRPLARRRPAVRARNEGSVRP